MMKAEVMFELPADDAEATQAMIEKAREYGYPRLSVVLEAKAVEGKRSPTRADLAYALGQEAVELSQEIGALGGAGKFVTTKLVDE